MSPQIHKVTLLSTAHVKRRRATTKVRTGCSTCRKRRIKCDETKPLCENCRASRRECHGLRYSGNGGSKDCFAPIVSTEDLKVFHAPSVALPINDLQFRYFLLFQDYSAVDLTGYCQSDFWTRLVLQESHLAEPIRHAIIAIGALYKTVQIAQTHQSDFGKSQDHLTHFECAIQHYQKAIRSQQQALEKGHVPLRTSLMSSLLFVCFEAFYGDLHAVLEQIVCVVSLLQQYRSGVSRNAELSKKLQVTSRTEDHVEDELCQIVARLEVQLRAFDDVRPQRYCVPRPDLKPASLKIQKLNLFEPIQTFALIGDARRSWDLSMPSHMEAHHKAAYFKYCPRNDVPEEVIEDVALQIKALLSWKAAFDPLFEQIWADTAGKDRPIAAILKIKYLLSFMLTSTGLEPLETIFDQFLPQFREILSLSTYLLGLGRPSLLGTRPFLLDSAIIIPLFFTACKCRNRILRWAAIDLLRYSPPRREGMLDSEFGAKFAAWIVGLEEENSQGSEECDAPLDEKNRFRICDFSFDLRKKEGWARCGRNLTGTREFIDLRETMIYW